jgi:hypothetical protein
MICDDARSNVYEDVVIEKNWESPRQWEYRIVDGRTDQRCVVQELQLRVSSHVIIYRFTRNTKHRRSPGHIVHGPGMDL